MKLLITAVLGVAACGGSTTPPTAQPTPPTPPPQIAPAIAPIDIVVVLDMSKSMEETDVPPDRLAATKQAIRQFIATTERDRIGIVIYGFEAKLRSPLSTDTTLLDKSVADLVIGDVQEYGTALGDGLALAVAQLRASTAKHKAVVMLGDGELNVVREFDADQASAAAKSLGVVVHTILVGNQQPYFGASADPKSLTSIAATTGGTFYRATDQASFDHALHDIREKLDATARATTK
jgi:Ca-activated chloride channel family protein